MQSWTMTIHYAVQLLLSGDSGELPRSNDARAPNNQATFSIGFGQESNGFPKSPLKLVKGYIEISTTSGVSI